MDLAAQTAATEAECLVLSFLLPSAARCCFGELLPTIVLQIDLQALGCLSGRFAASTPKCTSRLMEHLM